MTDWTPKTNVAEWHITYNCNLRCVGCNRFVGAKRHAPDMTVQDAHEFIRQAAEMDWQPEIRILGGEPTLHQDLFEFIELAFAFTGRVKVVPRGYERVRVYSNGYSQKTIAILNRIRSEAKAFVPSWAVKRDGSVTFEHIDYCIAPRDIGDTRQPCDFHSARVGGCGISVDSRGYAVCQTGGAIDEILGLGARTRTLADLFDETFAAWQTGLLCSHCGGIWGYRHADKFPIIHGVPMSPRWQKAWHKG